jgi:hypothetical protein
VISWSSHFAGDGFAAHIAGVLSYLIVAAIVSGPRGGSPASAWMSPIDSQLRHISLTPGAGPIDSPRIFKTSHRIAGRTVHPFCSAPGTSILFHRCTSCVGIETYQFCYPPTFASTRGTPSDIGQIPSENLDAPREGPARLRSTASSCAPWHSDGRLLKSSDVRYDGSARCNETLFQTGMATGFNIKSITRSGRQHDMTQFY